MKFIRLTLGTDNREIYVNFSLVTDILKSEGGTTISFDSDYYYVVNEGVEEILSKINN